MIKLTIEEPIHSGNVILRTHYRDRKKMIETYEWWIAAALNDTGKQKPEKPPGQKMKLRIWSFRRRLLDKDRLYSGATVLVDAIKKMNLIKDDSPRWIDLTVGQDLDGKNPRTEIEILKSRFRSRPRICRGPIKKIKAIYRNGEIEEVENGRI
jgi:hypothetical protein